MSVSVVAGTGMSRLKSVARASSILDLKLGERPVSLARAHVYASFARGSSLFRPIFVATLRDHRELFINDEGKVYTVDQAGGHRVYTKRGLFAARALAE